MKPLCRPLSYRSLPNLLQLAVLKWAGRGRSITRTDLIAYRTELVVMSWDVVRSRHLVKHGELPTSYVRVATVLKATTTSHELTTPFRRVSATFHDLYRNIRTSCRTRSGNLRDKRRVMLCANSSLQLVSV